MKKFQFIETMPGQSNFDLFDLVLKSVYIEPRLRSILGNEPVLKHLVLCVVLLENGLPIGRFAYYENPLLEYKESKAACIGSYECIEDNESSVVLINYALNLARNSGFPTLIGPMEGSTWNNYRFSDDNSNPNFFMEPFHHSYYNYQFSSFGFFVIGQYVSNIIDSIQVDETLIKKYEDDFKKIGAHFRTIDLNDFESDLTRIAHFSIASFSENLLFTAIPTSEFVNKFISMKNYFDSRLIWIVENEQHDIEAVIFAIKDYNDSSNETLIIKSISRKKESTFKGIGQYLAMKVMGIAKELNYTKIIHALMFVDNRSVDISSQINSKSYKSYKLYALNTCQNGQKEEL